MSENRNGNNLNGHDIDRDPIRLVDENDPTLTLVEDDDLAEEDTIGASMDAARSLDDYDEETAAELAAPPSSVPFQRDEEEADETEEANMDDATAGKGVGTFAIVLSILSLFFLPILLGASGIVIGYVSRRYGARALGNWAIGIGAFSILMTVLFSPFF
ncbi:DUF4190 domain-containing protein [Halalkalibacterium halodurans]|uniref:BH1400 protein n=2 Tax=Halalkalibacterium halodurans TaxID=86665 RepID=Q9KD19_HALH5|nr:hypothetical protein [Halalkalibacterium halodurans]MED4124824.1 DUF4190 domain-containing protein [Halalkalibacterium halodurans]MED4174245.1 DUF4190 domain-containing protein [Halalkalibacterium halodurans]BAB05119.1 BH1400 [Halalkalibacterium halodurans C-125]